MHHRLPQHAWPADTAFPVMGGYPAQRQHLSPRSPVASASRGPSWPHSSVLACAGVSPRLIPHILVVDDSITVRTILKICLERAGFEVRAFEDGIALLRWLSSPEACIPDLILLDLVLPKMDGYTIARHLKAKPSLKQTILLFLSQKDRVLDRVKGHLVGAHGYLTKPFRTEDMLAAVLSALDLALPGEHPSGSLPHMGLEEPTDPGIDALVPLV